MHLDPKSFVLSFSDIKITKEIGNKLYFGFYKEKECSIKLLELSENELTLFYEKMYILGYSHKNLVNYFGICVKKSA
jgi:hypothetical protein